MTTPENDEASAGRRGRAVTRPVAERHAAREAGRARIGLTANHRGQTKLPAVLVDAVRDGKADASHAVLWAVVCFLDSLTDGRGYCDAAQGTLADAIGTSDRRVGRLLADASPLFRNELDGRGPVMSREVQDQGLTTHLWARRKVNGRNMGAWAPTWTVTLVCDGTAHEQLVPARLISPAAWVAYAVLVWRAGDEGSCRRTIKELAAELGVSERVAQRLTRELREAGLLLVRDRRGEARKRGQAAAGASTYIPVVVREQRPQGRERSAVALLRQLPAELPQAWAWTLDRLDPTAGLTASRSGRVGFGGWAAWRALAELGPVELFLDVLTQRYGVADETAAQWGEEAVTAGLMTLGEDMVTWRPVLENPASAQEEPGEGVESMASGLSEGMTSGLSDPMRSGLSEGMASGLSDEVETLTSDPAYGGGLMSVSMAEVVGGEGDLVAAPPQARLVDADACERPAAGADKIKPRGEDVAQVLGAPEARWLLLDRMNGGQQRKLEQIVGEAVAEWGVDRVTSRLTMGLSGKSREEIANPFGWARTVITTRWGCYSDCTCQDPACERGSYADTAMPCRHCEGICRQARMDAAAAQPAVVEDLEDAPAPSLTVVPGARKGPAPMDRPLLASVPDDDPLPPEERLTAQEAMRQARAANRAAKGLHRRSRVPYMAG
ncbi:hypothetical protein [Streptomyces griseoluteus]|uniref:hypothetical protein n=1 Tax=Streptomyces griseoluteus TaxID=29306 RepID=UPI0033177F0E